MAGGCQFLIFRQFEVKNSEQMALVGKSGCGKTTLLHTIAGITRADAGEILIDGLNIATLSEAGVDKVRADRIGYVFQTFNLLPGFTAFENVLLGMTFARNRKDPQRARQLLDRVGLSHRSTHKPTALSVGEQQRVAVAPRWRISRACSWPMSRRRTSIRGTSKTSSI